MLIFIIENIRKPIGIGYYTEIFDSEILATALSFESQFKTLVAAILAPAIGLIADLFGIGYSLMIISGILICTMPLFSLKRKD